MSAYKHLLPTFAPVDIYSTISNAFHAVSAQRLDRGDSASPGLL